MGQLANLVALSALLMPRSANATRAARSAAGIKSI
jgi:hypothetical protein